MGLQNFFGQIAWRVISPGLASIRPYFYAQRDTLAKSGRRRRHRLVYGNGLEVFGWHDSCCFRLTGSGCDDCDVDPENGGSIMNARPSPVRKKGERNLYCPNYGECLDHAVDHKWRSWNCSTCAFKSVQELAYPVMTVNDSNICYELPRTLPQEVWYSFG